MDSTRKIGRFKKSWLLTKGASRGLLMDKELLFLPVLAFIASIFTLLTILAIGFLNPSGIFYRMTTGEASADFALQPAGIALVVILGVISAIITTFMTGALIHAALERFKGNDPTIRSSLAAAWRHKGALALFAIFAYGVGTLISTIAERLPVIGNAIVSFLAGAAWGIASFFAIPVIVSSDEHVGPIKATKTSVGLIKKVWGESVILSIGIAIITFLAFLGLIAIYAALMVLVNLLFANGILFAIVTGLLLIAVITFLIVCIVLDAYVKAAVYHYATTGQSPVVFDTELMRQAFTPKKARALFRS